MRFSSIVSLAAAAAPLAVSAARGQLGYALGDKKPDGSCKFTADYEADFAALNTHIVRTYSSSDCNTAGQILPAAAKHGIQVILGVWHTASAYAADKSALQKAIPANPGAVYAITVGSETLYRGDLNGSGLLKLIKDMQATFPNIKVGTADSWNKYADGTADPVIQGGVKLLLVNAFAYWQGQKISNATATYLDDLMQAFTRIQQTAGSIDSIELWNGETGWPGDGGSNYGSAIAGTDNAKTFFKKGVCAAIEWGFNVFYFEAFDEPWKPKSTGDTGSQGDETHWGAYTAERVPKFSLTSTPSLSRLVTSSPPTRIPGDFDTAWSSSGVKNSSRSSTVWTAPSPSQIFPFSSPRLPSFSGFLDSSTHPYSDSPAPHHRSDNSAYYTALWGSPISPEAVPGRHLHQRKFSIITADGSPSRGGISNKARGFALKQDQIYTDRVRADTLAGDISTQRNSAVRVASPLAQRSARYGFTQDWLRNSNVGSKNSERGNWWSDESDCSEKEPLDPPQVVGKFKPEEAWSRLRGESNHLEASSLTVVDQGRFERSDTQVKAILSTKMPPPSSMDPQSLPDAVIKPKTQNMEKALPPTPPPDRTGSEETLTKSALNSSNPPSAGLPPSSSGQSSLERPRKRVTWRKRICIIALPLCDDQDEKMKNKVYLTPKDVEDRLAMWRSQGFNTNGFSLTSNFEDRVENLSKGQSRVIFPIPEDADKMRIEGAYRVNIPNRQEWEDHVCRLKEEKLRALGVSFGEEESSTVNSPVITSMTRHASSQSSAMPISPLFAASPAVVSRGNQNSNPIPPPFTASINLGSHINSHPILSPQQKAAQAMAHLSKYSTGFAGTEHGFSPGYQLSQAQSPLSGTWSPQHYLSSQGNSRVASPAVNGHIQSLANALSQLPLPAQDRRGQGVPHVPNGGLLPMLHQQAQVQSQLLQQQHQQHQITLQPRLGQTLPNPHNKKESKSAVYNSQPEIFTPIPRGHHQNLSETLQRELDDAELHPEESRAPVTRQGERALDFTFEERLENAEEPPILANILKNTNRESNFDDSDLDTNPSLSGTPKPQKTYISRHHSSKSSISKLNVNAPEFISERKKPLAPEVFAFQGNQPVSSSSNTERTRISLNNSHSKHTSQEPNINSILNVAAPSFTPANAHKQSAPSRAFSFSTKIPASQPAATTLQTTSVNDLISSKAAQSKKADTDRIFSDVNYSEIIKPVKKSRAIPIVRPKTPLENSGHDVDGQEDESGRITQPDGRQKRMRRNNDSGDEVPLFHEIPSASERIITLESVGTLDPEATSGKTDVALRKVGNRSKDITDNSAVSDASSLAGDHEAIDADGKPWEPFSFQDVEGAANFNAARSILPSTGKGLQELNLDLGNVLDVEERSFQKKAGRLASSSLDISDGYDQLIGSAIRDVERDSLPAATNILENILSEVISNSDGGSASNVSLSPTEKACPACSQSASQSSASTDQPKIFVKSSIMETRKGDSDVLDLVAETALANSVAYLPSYHEIDAVMKHLNEDGSDLGVERNPSPWRQKSPIRTPLAKSHDPNAGQLLQMPQMRSDAPSPSPNRLRQPFQYLPESDLESPLAAEVEMIARNARFSPSYRPSKESLFGTSPVHRLNSPDNVPVSDWDDLISSTEETKFLSRAGFFDHRTNDLVGRVVQQRLGPLEKALAGIQNSLATLSDRAVGGRIRRSFSGEVEDSDADDEDEDNLTTSESRIKSPLKDRTYEKLKALIIESSMGQQHSTFTNDVSEIREAMKELKASIERPQPSSDIKTAVEEAVARQMRGRSGPIISSHESATVEKLQLQITGLESMLKIAESRADDELKARRATEDALADSQRLLRMAMQEAAEQRESAEETERSLSAFHDERQHVLRRTAMLEGAQESLQKTASDLTEKNAALESTLAEYRLSSSQWRDEVEEAKAENKDLQRTINALKVEIEDSIRGRQTLRTKFDRLQEDMTLASRDIARDQSRWRRAEEENKARFEVMSTKLEAECRTKEKLEAEIMTLLTQEKETTIMRHNLEQCQRVISQQQEVLDNLRSENLELQNSAARYERELHNARETAKMEVERTHASAELDIETANNQVNIMSSDLQRVIARLQNQLDEASEDTSATKARHDVMLEEASESRNSALREAAEAREAALQEHCRFHQRTVEELKAQHSRDLNNALEDKQRLEIHLNDRLALADEKVLHLQERTSHLEEKLEIAKSAAHAAALAAQSKIASSPSALRKGSDIPEKVSPQALRESIIVLQEQLQEREGRIEQLELEASQIDKDAPARLKEREIEVVWLRELLGVRIGDLEDVIKTLSQPSYDREAVKDAAIRLKANLQMEQQEKERALAGSQTFPSLASISNLASSPRALPLAAAAAWGNWRKSRDTSFGSLSGIANGNVDQTPSRSSPSTQGFLSGLLTPPSTTRQTPQSNQNGRSSRHASSTAKTTSGVYRTPRQSLSLQDEHRPLRAYNPPETPPLMRKASYDCDAESPAFGDTDGEEIDVDGHTRKGNISGEEIDVDGHTRKGNISGDEPFGPSIGEFSERG